MDAKEFLALLELPHGSGRFVLGPFDPGVTLLKQQTRALNLIYALESAGRLSKAGSKIAVIGGGVAGLTASLAAARFRCKVSLIERRHSLLHLQQGCDTRWLHPHIYEWPLEGSQRDYAGLPILDWRAGSASHVAKQISTAFNDAPERKSVDVYLGADLRSVKSSGSGVGASSSVDWVSTQPNQKLTRKFDFVIFAVGFGVERNVNHHWPAYWRNDSIHQIDPHLSPSRKTTVLISGTGDGGLIDLMRTTLSAFDHQRIHDDLFQTSNAELFKQLNLIRENWAGRPADDKSWLHQRIDELEQEGLLTEAIKKISSRMRPDTSVVLNGNPSNFSEAIQLDNASMFSSVVAFCLNHCNAFDYKAGKLTIDANLIKINGKTETFDQVILRHGADTRRTFDEARCQEAADVLANPDSVRKYINTAKRIWPVNWWPEKTGRNEPVSPPTELLATTFVSTLRDLVQLAHEESTPTDAQSETAKFRITLHRVMQIQGDYYYQQIAQYAGTGGDGQSSVGRTFDLNRGLGGLCCRLGQPVVLRKGSGFDEVRAQLELNLTPARPIASSTESFLAVPFFASSVETAGKQVCLLLYADSSAANFFSQPVLNMIYTACRGLVNNLEMMIGSRAIALSAPDFAGIGCSKSEADIGLLKQHKNIIFVDEKTFSDYADRLTFRSIRFFEIAHGINTLNPLT